MKKMFHRHSIYTEHSQKALFFCFFFFFLKGASFKFRSPDTRHVERPKYWIFVTPSGDIQWRPLSRENCRHSSDAIIGRRLFGGGEEVVAPPYVTQSQGIPAGGGGSK